MKRPHLSPFRMRRPPTRFYGLVAASVLFMLPLLFAPLAGRVGGAGAGGGWRSFGLRGESVRALSVVSDDDTTLFYAQTPSGLWRKTASPGSDGSGADGSGPAGPGWQRIDTGLPHAALGVPLIAAWQTVPGQPLRLYALAGATDARQLYGSEDGGTTWQWISPAPGAASPALAVLPGAEGEPDIIIVETSSRLQRSLDGGATWTPGGAWPPNAENNDTKTDPVRELLVGAEAPDRIVAVSRSGELWLSENGGLSWRTGVLQGLELTAATLAGTKLWAASAGRSAGELLYSSDDAVTWDNRSLPVQSSSSLSNRGQVVALEPEPRMAGGLYAATGDGKTYHSIDGGGTWELLGTPGASHLVGLAVQPDTGSMLYAATDDGIWVRAVAPIVPTATPPATITPSPTVAIEPTLTALAVDPTAAESPTATKTRTRTPTVTLTTTPTDTPTATATPTLTATATRPRATATRRLNPTPRPTDVPVVPPTHLPPVQPTTPPAAPTAEFHAPAATPTTDWLRGP